MNLMFSGLPGQVSSAIAEVMINEGYDVLDTALTGPKMPSEIEIAGKIIKLIAPKHHESFCKDLEDTIAVDFTDRKVVNQMMDLYCRYNIPSIVGTTGGDRKALVDSVEASDTYSVIAPNMALHIVAYQKAMKEFSDSNPGLFKGSQLKIDESHQNWKADTSGTAKAMVKYFNKLGIDFDKKDINQIRDIGKQKSLGVPEQYLDGHGWHFYTVIGGPIDKLAERFTSLLDEKIFSEFVKSPIGKHSKDGNIMFEMYRDDDELTLVHKINGRKPYAEGIKSAKTFLEGAIYVKSIIKDVPGRVATMVDIL